MPDSPSEPFPGAVPPPAFDRVHQILLDTARQLGSSLDPDAVFTRMLDSVRGAMRCDGLVVSDYDRERGIIRCAFAWVGGNRLDASTLPVLTYREDSKGMQSQVIRTGRPALFQDVVDRVRDPGGKYYEVDRAGGVRDLRDADPPLVRSAIMAPIRLEGEVIGVAQVMADAQGVYTALDLELLEGLSLLLAVALENARLFRRAQEELEERRRAEDELRRTEEALRQADRRKDEFLATLGHELRNPLSPIRNAVELLGRTDPADDETGWARDVIRRQVTHLTRLIDDLLDVSRITQGKLVLRRDTVALDELLRSTIEAARPAVETAGQALVLRPTTAALCVHADPVRLSQVFANLIDNASKYSRPGTTIEVSVESGGEQAVVCVSDEGCGIPADQLPSVFELFFQVAGSMDRASDGLGLGLTLVKRLVEAHGGTVEAASDGPGRGSRFSVRLPVVAMAAPTMADAARTETALGPWRILVADDNHDAADSIAMLLGRHGHDVRVAYDGEQALSMAESALPHVLVLDIGMPRLDGYEVARRVRARPWGHDRVLIAVTGWGQDEDIRRSTEVGFDAHLVKPLDPHVLLRLLGDLASRAVV